MLHVCLVPSLQARQALGVGPDAFLPSNLDAQAITLKELDVFAPNLRDMLEATQAFAENTNSKRSVETMKPSSCCLSSFTVHPQCIFSSSSSM